MGRLGLVLYHGIESGPELKQYGQIAEDAGYESLWVTERYFHEEIFSLLGYLGAATLDRITGGRFLLGLGRSERSVIQDKMGMPYGNSQAAMNAAVSLVKRLLSGERVTDTEGPFTLRKACLATKPIQQNLPIYLAAIGEKGLRLAGAIADGILLNAYVPPSYVKYAVEEIRSAAQEAGRNPQSIDIACMLVIRLTDDPHSMMPTLKKRIVRLLDEAFVGEILLKKGGFDPSILGPLRESYAKDEGKEAVGLITDEMVESFYLVGSAEKCKEGIAEYRQAGVDLPLLLPRLEDYKRVAEELKDA